MCVAGLGKGSSSGNAASGLAMAIVDLAGIKQDICVKWIDNVKTGDSVSAHVGTALSKLDEEDALLTIESLRAMGDIE